MRYVSAADTRCTDDGSVEQRIIVARPTRVQPAALALPINQLIDSTFDCIKISSKESSPFDSRQLRTARGLL